MSQAELADATQTSQATVSAYEGGRKEPWVATFSRLLAATGSRLRVQSGRQRLVEPSVAQQEQVARTLVDVIALAAALPERHDPVLRYPRLPPAKSRPAP
jgi:transcriptional regulator with XRE-family HTH domain